MGDDADAGWSQGEAAQAGASAASGEGRVGAAPQQPWDAYEQFDDAEESGAAPSGHGTGGGNKSKRSESALAGGSSFSGGVAKPGSGNKVGNKMAPPAGPVKLKNLDNLRSAITNLEKMLRSESSDIQLEATKKFRQLLSVGDRDPMGSVQDMLDQNIVPQLLRFLKKSGHAALQVEALWALTNIAAGTTEHTHLLIKNNAVPTLVALLDSTHQEVLEQAVWVLGNIAGDGTAARDTVLAAGALEPLLRCMRDNKKTSLLRIATWTLSNLCDGQPRPVFKVGQVLQTVREVLQSDDTEVLSHACWALSHLCDGPSPHIQAVVLADVCQRLVELLHCKSWRVVKPALRTVGNIVCAEDDQDYTQQIIECGAVPCLRALIKNNNREIQKEACWTLSNIAAGTIDQIQCVLDSGSIPSLVELASKDAGTDPDVRIEACWVLLNATSCGSDSQIQFLVNAGCISVLCTLLDDNSMVLMALEGLEKILQVGEEHARAAAAGVSSAAAAAAASRLLLGDSGGSVAAAAQTAAAAAAAAAAAGIGATVSLAGTAPGAAPGAGAAAPVVIHAGLLDTVKIEQLQRHRSSTIAKRAAKMWKQHFVVCAICRTAYSKNSTKTKFCPECKCDVCASCNCGVYHLSYQDALWKDLAEGEAKQQTSKLASKKSKKKKKKLKDKKRKEQQSVSKDQPKGKGKDKGKGGDDESGSDDDDGDDDGDEEDDQASPAQPVAPVRASGPGPGPGAGAGGSSHSSNSSSKPAPTAALPKPFPKPPPRLPFPAPVATAPAAVADKDEPEPKPTTPAVRQRQRGTQGADKAPPPQPATFKDATASALRNLSLDDLPGHEDDEAGEEDYVQFLANNGSILDLWKLINENENSKSEESPPQASKS